ncbi:hypothetical protein [Aquimarina sp. I32.4]|uniref:hypothetical protein n=1 Tax=Aquimarina sp. I32.4 TaxID=2053903 RepID=UPI000CDE890D|nr:hypothetical protein [Aquimarina sp. I32.4]
MASNKKKKRKKKRKIGCMPIVITLVTIVFTFLNFKWYTQDRFWITYYGTPHEMVVVELDSVKVRKYYNYYNTLKFVDSINYSNDEIDFVQRKVKLKVGKIIEVNVLDNKAAFTEKPDVLYSIFLGVLMLGSWYIFFGTVLYRFFINY